ncbi:TPA: hypothetical protein ACWMJX_003326, partial [Klebsiella pneumoniae]
RASAAPPGKDSGRGAAFMPGGGNALPGLHNTGINTLYYQTVALISQARASAAPPGKNSRRGTAFMPGGGVALPGLHNTGTNLI